MRKWRGPWVRRAAEGQTGGLGYSRVFGPFRLASEGQSCRYHYTTPPAPRHDYPPTKRACIPKCCPSIASYVLARRCYIETRHRWLLRARYAAAGKRATSESVADVSTTLFSGTPPGGVFSPGLFLLLLMEVPPTSLFSPGTTFYRKRTLALGGIDKRILRYVIFHCVQST